MLYTQIQNGNLRLIERMVIEFHVFFIGDHVIYSPLSKHV